MNPRLLILGSILGGLAGSALTPDTSEAVPLKQALNLLRTKFPEVAPEAWQRAVTEVNPEAVKRLSVLTTEPSEFLPGWKPKPTVHGSTWHIPGIEHVEKGETAGTPSMLTGIWLRHPWTYEEASPLYAFLHELGHAGEYQRDEPLVSALTLRKITEPTALLEQIGQLPNMPLSRLAWFHSAIDDPWKSLELVREMSADVLGSLGTQKVLAGPLEAKTPLLELVKKYYPSLLAGVGAPLGLASLTGLVEPQEAEAFPTSELTRFVEQALQGGRKIIRPLPPGTNAGSVRDEILKEAARRGTFAEADIHYGREGIGISTKVHTTDPQEARKLAYERIYPKAERIVNDLHVGREIFLSREADNAASLLDEPLYNKLIHEWDKIFKSRGFKVEFAPYEKFREAIDSDTIVPIGTVVYSPIEPNVTKHVLQELEAGKNFVTVDVGNSQRVADIEKLVAQEASKKGLAVRFDPFGRAKGKISVTVETRDPQEARRLAMDQFKKHLNLDLKNGSTVFTLPTAWTNLYSFLTREDFEQLLKAFNDELASRRLKLVPTMPFEGFSTAKESTPIGLLRSAEYSEFPEAYPPAYDVLRRLAKEPTSPALKQKLEAADKELYKQVFQSGKSIDEFVENFVPSDKYRYNVLELGKGTLTGEPSPYPEAPRIHIQILAAPGSLPKYVKPAHAWPVTHIGYPTVGWARIRQTGKDEWFIEELQSDLEDLLRKHQKDNPDPKIEQTLEYIRDWPSYTLATVLNEARQRGIEEVRLISSDAVRKLWQGHLSETKAKRLYDDLAKKFGFKLADNSSWSRVPVVLVATGAGAAALTSNDEAEAAPIFKPLSRIASLLAKMPESSTSRGLAGRTVLGKTVKEVRQAAGSPTRYIVFDDDTYVEVHKNVLNSLMRYLGTERSLQEFKKLSPEQKVLHAESSLTHRLQYPQAELPETKKLLDIYTYDLQRLGLKPHDYVFVRVPATGPNFQVVQMPREFAELLESEGRVKILKGR
jgi:hypothetical protein